MRQAKSAFIKTKNIIYSGKMSILNNKTNYMNLCIHYEVRLYMASRHRQRKDSQRPLRRGIKMYKEDQLDRRKN